MSLSKIPFILLATWGIHTTYTSPNPPPPQHERVPSSLTVPFENYGLVKWIPIVCKVTTIHTIDFTKEFAKRLSG